jgi:hypothetical protein
MAAPIAIAGSGANDFKMPTLDGDRRISARACGSS